MTIRIAIDLELHNDGPTPENPRPECYGIIQLGWAIFSTERGILEVGGDYIKTGKPLSPYIKKLTKITERDIEERGVSIHEAYLNMQARFNHWVAEGKERGEGAISQICEWGSLDSDELKQELLDKQYHGVPFNHLKPHQELVYFKEYTDTISDVKTNDCRVRNNYTWTFGRATLNIKAVYQMFMIAQCVGYRGGLRKSCQNLGIPSEPYLHEVKPGVFKQKTYHDARMDAKQTALVYLELQKYMRTDIIWCP